MEKTTNKENWYEINFKQKIENKLKRKNFIEQIKSFFNIEDSSITRSYDLFFFLKDRYKYNTSAMILTFLQSLEIFEDNFDITDSRIKRYLSSLKSYLKGCAKKNEEQSVKNLHFRKLEKRYVKKLGLEIISII